MKASRADGWEASYENADGDIYLPRSGVDAARIAVKDSVIRVDASDTRHAEFDRLGERVRDQVISEAAAIAVKPAMLAAAAARAPA